MSEAIRCISVDVEEYFQIESARKAVPRNRWYQWPTRVEASMDRLLELFAAAGCRATLFVLGHVAELHPEMIRRCAAAGHEIASHGYWHDRLHQMTPDAMWQDAGRTKKLLEDLTGRAVLGYRAPTWSITPQTSWAIDVLAELGYIYDSSIFPVFHPQYGVPQAPPTPFLAQDMPIGRTMLEIPPLVWRTMGRNLPVAGGGYFRVLPLALMKHGLRQAAEEGRPAVLYFHPWEFDPQIPRLPLSLVGKMRTYLGLSRSMSRLEAILKGFDGWQPIVSVLPACRAMAEARDVFTLRPRVAA